MKTKVRETTVVEQWNCDWCNDRIKDEDHYVCVICRKDCCDDCAKKHIVSIDTNMELLSQFDPLYVFAPVPSAIHVCKDCRASGHPYLSVICEIRQFISEYMKDRGRWGKRFEKLCSTELKLRLERNQV